VPSLSGSGGKQKVLERRKITNRRYVMEEKVAVAKLGKLAPDFEAEAFMDGTFKRVRLSDYRGQWIVLSFYPGDFTFV
jgi:hypothetical protein